MHNAPVRLPFVFRVFSPLALLTIATAALGCNEAPLIGASDAGNPCLAPVLEYACHPQDKTLPGCAPDLDSGGAPLLQEEVLDGGSFPVGCTVIIYSCLLYTSDAADE